MPSCGLAGANSGVEGFVSMSCARVIFHKIPPGLIEPALSHVPPDLYETIESATQLSLKTPGFLGENEIRFLGILAACTPAKGAIVEIGSFKGKSTVVLATMAAKYGLGPVVAIDPHQGLSYLGPGAPQQSPTFDEFLGNVRSAGLEANVEVQRAYSRDVAKTWSRPIRLLWIDGDHSYKGCKEDFDLFSPCLADGAVVAFHDALNAVEGPIRVFTEEVLPSDRFGPSGFVHSIAWSQFRPRDGTAFRKSRAALQKLTARLVPFVVNDQEPQGLRKIAYKLTRSRVPRELVVPQKWVELTANGK
jgi:predicted O-methyltransferase YrrM